MKRLIIIVLTALVACSKPEFVQIKQTLRRGETTKDDPDYDVYRFSPILYGRGIENTYTDIPLLMYYEKKKTTEGLRELSYTVIFSNEDGGTNTEGLLQNWGRTTDIEWIYSAFLNKEGKFVIRNHDQRNDTRKKIRVSY